MSEQMDYESLCVDAQVERDEMYVQACRLDRVAQHAEQLLALAGFDWDTLRTSRELQEAYFGLREAIDEAYCCDECKAKVRGPLP